MNVGVGWGFSLHKALNPVKRYFRFCIVKRISSQIGFQLSRFHGVMVITSDFDSDNLSSILSGTFCYILRTIGAHFVLKNTSPSEVY